MDTPDVNAAILERLVALDGRLERIEAELQLIARRQRALDDLVAEFGPLAKEVYQSLLHELCGVEGDFDLDQIAELARKLLRNTRRFSELLDLLASTHDFLRDATPLGKDVLHTLIERLDDFERRGGFAFARQSLKIAERVMEEFTPEDVEKLAENVTAILKTARSMTQPDVLRMVNGSLEAVRAEQPAPLTPWGALKALHDPETQQGLALAVAMLRRFPAALNPPHPT
jgi:uncharacterized protein YjgD (DUF1641 family)